MVSRSSRRWLLVILAFTAIVIVCGVYFRLVAVPIRTLDDGWYRKEFFERVPVDPETRADFKWTIVRARLDQFVAPAPPARRILEFVNVFRDGEDRVFLRFWGETHVMVVYCWSPTDRKLLWKAIEYHSA
jgi:hypothetical protein